MGIFSQAKKPATDVRAFLKGAASASSLKYAAEAGKKHYILVPYQETALTDDEGKVVMDNGTPVMKRDLFAYSAKVHEWTADSKFKSCICLKGLVRTDENGNMLNNGECPFCDRVGASWDIYRYRKELEETTCQLTGEAREKHLETVLQSYRNDMKCRSAKDYIYLLVAQFKYENNRLVIGNDNLPEYELKIMRMSANRISKIEEQLSNSNIEFAGSELLFAYPNLEDKRQVVGQSTVAPVFKGTVMETYPTLKDKIFAECDKFDWDNSIEKAFPEWEGMSSAAASTTVESMFVQWDEYQKALENPATAGTARYLEYVVTAPTANPSLDGAMSVPEIAMAQPQIPGAVPMPNVPNVAPAPNVTPAAPVVGAPVAPVVGAPVAGAPVAGTPVVGAPVAPTIDPNLAFAAPNGGTPSVEL